MPQADSYGTRSTNSDFAKQALDAFVSTQRQDLAAEIRGLRQEMAALRKELKPVSGLIATGSAVLDEFKRLSGA